MDRTTKRSSWSFWVVAVCFVAGLAASAAGAIGGFLVGATYGARYATQFEFAGLRGYEATGLIGELIGFAAVGLLSFYPVRRVANDWL